MLSLIFCLNISKLFYYNFSKIYTESQYYYLIHQYILIYKYYYAKILKNRIKVANMETFFRTVGAINDETRVSILRFIDKNGEMCVCDIENSFGMIQSRISRHLKILKESGFLRVKRKGRWAYYSIRKPLDKFRQNILAEIEYLELDIPRLECKSEKEGDTVCGKRA